MLNRHNKHILIEDEAQGQFAVVLTEDGSYDYHIITRQKCNFCQG